MTKVDNIEFEKDGVVKSTHPKFMDDLIAVGWSVVGKKSEITAPPKELSEYDQLKLEAKELGIEYMGNIKKADLKKLIEEENDKS